MQIQPIKVQMPWMLHTLMWSFLCKLRNNGLDVPARETRLNLFLSLSLMTISYYLVLYHVKFHILLRNLKNLSLCGYAHFKLPYHLKALRNAAGSRTKILFFDTLVFKQKWCLYNFFRKKFISWTIEWRFHSTNIVLHDHVVNENCSFSSIIEKHLKPGPWNHPLLPFCDEQLDSLKLFIRKYPKFGPKSPFKGLDMKAPIRQQLANVVILEFPIIHVFLPYGINFEVIKDVSPIIPKSLQKDQEGNQSPEGLSFREEEIDDKSSGPQVLDLMKHVDSSSSYQMLSQASKSPSGGFAKEIEEEARDLLPAGELLPVPEELEEGKILE
ncbi:hypothetical protein L6164_037703 [Bauhinia variegata]|uniref:Uncharacterized protein n=1 Tax=Bauhinia variegata TaxID=167791 RepID=A0ACB9KKZ4_BAUVA|nr:hypothetical protein L6164_037703 [Bauhinia variegata]